MKSDALAKSLKRLERVKGIEPSYSAWKSPNSVMQTISVLTFCGLAAQPEQPRRLGEFVDYGSPAWPRSVGARFRRRWAQPINTTVSTMVRVETAAMVGSI